MARPTTHRLVAVIVSVFVAVAALEVLLRMGQGALFRFQSFTADPPRGLGLIVYHDTFGWTTAPGQHRTNPTYGVEASGLRSHGSTAELPGPPVLLVGDSFTFGDEVADSDTWAARLQDLIGRRVLNAGVPAYGIDQAVLRGESLLERHHPSVVILSFISDDITRTEFDYYPFGRGWKPYFEIAGGALQLRNTPVPITTAPRRFSTLRHALGYSYVADAVFRRIASRWWRNFPPAHRVHEDGDRVSAELVARLAERVRGLGGRFFAVAFATNGGLGGNRRLAAGVSALHGRGIDVLDLSSEVLEADEGARAAFFMRDGHYSPSMNRRVAARIAAHLGGGPSVPPLAAATAP